MSYKPVMKTIGSKLRGLFSTSGQTVESALPNEIEASGSGSDSGSSGGVVTLYFAYDESTDTFSKAYKDIAMTEDFSSYEEAVAALTAATVVKLCLVLDGDISGVYIAVGIGTLSNPVMCTVYTGGSISIINVAINNDDGDK